MEQAGRLAVAYDVAGSNLFTATVGIPDNAINAIGLAETVTFASQDGKQLAKPVVVSLGHPATVQFNITGVTQLEVACAGVNHHAHQSAKGNQLTLGDAVIF